MRGPVPHQQSSSSLTNSLDRYANPNYGCNPQSMSHQLQSQTPRLFNTVNYPIAYGNNLGQTNYQTSSFHSRSRIIQVFGSNLAGPDSLEHNHGSRDGQIQFIQHPTGDVSAHQWTGFHWTNLGQFSNTRQRIEGQLASDRIKGQFSSMLSQLDGPAYFRQVALQRDPQSGSDSSFETFGRQNPSRSALENHNPVTGALQGRHANREGRNWLYAQSQGPNSTAQSTCLDRSQVPFSPMDLPAQQEGSMGARDCGTSKPQAEMQEVESANTLEHDASSWEQSDSTAKQSPADDHFSSTRPLNNSMDTNMSWGRSYPPNGSEQTSDHPYQQRSAEEGSKGISQDLRTESNQANPLNPNVRLPYSITGRPESLLYSSNESNMSNFAGDISPGNLGTNTDRLVTRTVLHDPLRVSDSNRATHPSLLRGVVPANPSVQSLETSRPENSHHVQSGEPSHVLTTGDFGNSLRISEPDEECPSRPVYDTIRDSSAYTTHHPTSYEESLNDWWSSKDQRGEWRIVLDDFPIRAEPAFISYHKPNETSHETILRLFSNAYDALASYVKGTPQYRDNPLSRFGKPPEWCIDKTPAGSNSFFGEDWGTPPSRVGRDPRYRPLPSDSRYITYDEPDRGAGYNSRFRFDGSHPM